MTEVDVNQALAFDHGLNADEYNEILALINRVPTLTELGIFSALWSEHCSYKTTKKWLRRLPTESPAVIQGPGENAGVVDIGENKVAIFKMESHNHPSYIEPYQGAATGVGGILRDIFTMGARPVGVMNALFFGEPDHPRTRHIINGVVGGIAGYGNAFGVPNVGGMTVFDKSYNGNCLVNAFAVGIAERDSIFYAAAAGANLPLVYFGARTGRDGIHGASMSSSEFDEQTEAKRPTVQVGDPFTERQLLEATLELMRSGVVLAIQDMGAAGLSCSAAEMGAKGQVGVELNLDLVPVREEAMSSYEIMLSESQERMMAVIDPARQSEAELILKRWDLDFAVIGQTTEALRFVVKQGGEVKADLPILELSEHAPEYDRPRVRKPVDKTRIDPESLRVDIEAATLKLLSSPDVCSKRPIYQQYDYFIGNQTLAIPGGDAALIRIEGTDRALALTADVTPRYVEADPFEGGKQAVAEAWRNLTAVGALPLAVTDNLNFANPEKPEIMAQLVDAIKGISEACSALEFPIVSGNVSLYNESSGQSIKPTPTIGGVGLIIDYRRRVSLAYPEAGLSIMLLGGAGTHMGRSLLLRDVLGREEGAPPPVDLERERAHGDFIRRMVRDGLLCACHDISDGGLMIALVEMALASNLGLHVTADLGDHPQSYLFGEDQARYVIVVKSEDRDKVKSAARARALPLDDIGLTGGGKVTIGDVANFDLDLLRNSHSGWLESFMG